MDNLYSLFYTGQQNPYGIGAWDSKGRKLKHSSSQPFLYHHSRTLSKKNTRNSNDSQNLKLPLIHSRPTSHRRKRKYTNSSSESSSYQYDANNNKKELSNFVKDINNSIAVRLQNDNFIAQQKLNNIKNNYNEIKTMLNNKIEKLEQDQQMQFDNLKYALEQGGGLKMMGAVKNANGGNNYDLRKAEEEDMLDATRKLPRLLENKMNIINNMKRKEKEDEKRLLSQVRKKVNEEIKKQKEKDEIRFKKEIDEIEQKRENIRQERRRLIEELQRNDFDESVSNTMYSNSPQMPPQMPPPQMVAPGMYPPQMMPQYPYHPSMYPPPPMNNNNNSDSTSEFLKIFLLKKLFDDKPQVINQSPQVPQFIPTPYPQMQPPQIQYQPMPQQPITYPQPIIYQSPPQSANPPNVIIQQDRGQQQIPNAQYKDVVITKTESLLSEKGIPFIDPLEEYLEETKTRKTKSKSRTRTKTKSKSKKSTSTRKKSTKKKSTKKISKKSEEEESESTPPPIKLKLDEPEKNKSKEAKKKKETKPQKSKEKEKKKDSKSKKKPSKPKKKKKEEEEEEFDEEEEEEEDGDEEEEEEEDDEEGEEEEDDAAAKKKK